MTNLFLGSFSCRVSITVTDPVGSTDLARWYNIPHTDTHTNYNYMMMSKQCHVLATAHSVNTELTPPIWNGKPFRKKTKQTNKNPLVRC